MNLRNIAFAVATAAALTAGLAQASETGDTVATVTTIEGVALVSQGANYVTAETGMALREGDRLMAMEGGSIQLTYLDGCKLTVDDNQVMRLGAADSCSTQTLSQSQVGPYLAQGPVAGIPAGLITAGVVGAVVIVGAASTTGSDDRRAPVSP